MTKPLKYDNRVMALTVVAVIIVLSFMCSRPNHIQSLAQIDSLLVKHEYRQALDSLQAMDRSEFKKKDNAYYNLLLTQAKYNSSINISNDSAISMAVDYYRQSNDHEKYTLALIFQGCVNERLGHLEKAVECYKTAAESADKNDISNRAFATYRMAWLYQSQYMGSPSIAVKKYKETWSQEETMQQFANDVKEENPEIKDDNYLDHQGQIYHIGDSVEIYLDPEDSKKYYMNF